VTSDNVDIFAYCIVAGALAVLTAGVAELIVESSKRHMEDVWNGRLSLSQMVFFVCYMMNA